MSIKYKEDKSSYLSGYRIAATYIGTVIGAGFASGQEIMQFFGFYGIKGLAGVLLTAFLFIFYGYIILRLGLKYRAHSYRDIIYDSGSKWSGVFLDFVITIFLMGTFIAMLAGTGAIFREQFGFPLISGSIFMVMISLVTTIKGLKGIVRALSIIVPFLLVGIFIISFMVIYNEFTLSVNSVFHLIKGEPPVTNWALSAVIYVSYNLIIAIAILGPMGARARDQSQIKKAAIIGGGGLGLGVLIILLPILLNLPEISNFEVPMIYIAGKFTLLVQIIYSLILIAEIYTTAVGNLFGFASRITNVCKLSYNKTVILTCIVGLLFSRLGFSQLVYYLYPVVGYAGLLLMAVLLYDFVREKYIV